MMILWLIGGWWGSVLCKVHLHDLRRQYFLSIPNPERLTCMQCDRCGYWKPKSRWWRP